MVMTEEKNVHASYIFFLIEVVTLLQSEAMVVKKLLVDDKITASVKQICLLSFICKVSNRKTLSGEPFAFLKSFATNLKFCVSSNLLFFTSCSLTHNQNSWNVSLFSCNPVNFV